MSSLIQNKKGEFAGYRNETQLNRDAQFKDIAMNLIDESGENWSMHGLSVLKRNSIARILYYDHLYRLQMDVPGVICEFGVHWGGGISTLLNLKGMLEPYNHARHIYGFDTFEGFASVDKKDGENAKTGDYASTDRFEETLDKILDYHQSIAPFPEVEKYTLVKGDVLDTVPQWMDDNPHALISMAIFDMDIYAPTKETLLRVLDRMPKGAILAFDELNCSFFPGETQAVQEVLGVKNLKLKKHPLQTYCAYCEIE